MAASTRDRPDAALPSRGQWQELLHCESGASAVEYGLLVTVIALAIFGALSALGNTISVDLFHRLGEYFASVGTSGDG